MLSSSLFATSILTLSLTTSAIPLTPALSNISSDLVFGPAVSVPQAISFGTFSDRTCGSNQVDYTNSDCSCRTLPGWGLKVWWFAETCRGYAYKSRDCSAQQGEMQIYVGQCYDTSQYNTIQIYCH